MSDIAASIDAELEATPKFSYGIRYTFVDGSAFYDIVDSVGEEDLDEEEFVADLLDSIRSTFENGLLIGGQTEGEKIAISRYTITAAAFRPTPYEEDGLVHG